VQLDAAPLATILVALAGPVGVTLGWWLGRRAERERQARDERKSAYVAFIKAAAAYRNAARAERLKMQTDRWGALAELILVAPPPLFEEAWSLVAAGDGLLAPELGDAKEQEIYRQMAQHFMAFGRLARQDLGITADPFGSRVIGGGGDPDVADA
jgi:hypothetical protein